MSGQLTTIYMLLGGQSKEFKYTIVRVCFFNLGVSQQTHNVATTSLQRLCNVVTLQRRYNNVPATLCVCWVTALGFLITDNMHKDIDHISTGNQVYPTIMVALL